MSWNPVNWWIDGWKDIADAPTAVSNSITSWFSTEAGNIASGVEGAMVAILGDVWDVIVGPLEILVGGIIIFLVLGWAFKNQVISLAMLAVK